MASLCLAPAEETAARSEEYSTPTLLIASFGSTTAADFAAQVGRLSHLVDLSLTESIPTEQRLRSVTSCVLFLDSGLNETQRHSACALLSRLENAAFVGVVSSSSVHFGDETAGETEAAIMNQLKTSSARVVVFRPSQVLGVNSQIGRVLRRFGCMYPLVPARLRSCFLDVDDLNAAIGDSMKAKTPRKRRFVTLLGPNRSWRDCLRERGAGGVRQAMVTAICYVLACLLLGHLAALVLDGLAWLRPAFRRWNFDTLRPASVAELLSLCNRFNHPHIKVVGYNNGVNHFGHRHPHRTIITTVQINRIRRVNGDTIKADCGVTIRQARDFLGPENQELFVLPNYSYVCLGTAFFIPIHGSASAFATVAETIVKALLYDPGEDRFLLATRDEPVFHDTVYNLKSRRIVLRLWIRVKPKSAYFALHQSVANPTAAAILAALRDQDAANVEIRKARGGAPAVWVSKYYTAAQERADVVEMPRDTLGRLWDQLEENALTSFLMHGFARNLIWHVELFLSEQEFIEFWRTHDTLSLRKIQVRAIRRDGLPHSPFRDHDCVSVDVFVFRWNRSLFETYLRKTFGAVRTNPGKHTQ